MPRETFDPFTLADRDQRRPYEDARSVAASGPVSRGAITIAMNRLGHDAKWRGLPRVLRELRAAGYVAYRPGAGWVATSKEPN